MTRILLALILSLPMSQSFGAKKTASSSLQKNNFTKGAELYSWKNEKNQDCYALLPGTNRMKTASEIKSHQLTETQLLKYLSKIPAQTEVLWNNSGNVSADVFVRIKKAASHLILSLAP